MTEQERRRDREKGNASRKEKGSERADRNGKLEWGEE